MAMVSTLMVVGVEARLRELVLRVASGRLREIGRERRRLLYYLGVYFEISCLDSVQTTKASHHASKHATSEA